MIDKFTLKSQKTILNTKIFDVVEKQYLQPDKISEYKAYVIKSADWANIIPITDNNEIILQEQYRYGTDTIEWEIPGGMIDPGELPLHAAKRELEEETGYISNDWKQIGVVNANPAIQTNKCYTFLAKNVENLGKINFDEDEYIEHKLVPISELQDYVTSGKITNTYIIAAIYFYFSHID